MDQTGDRSWGHLADTEHYGRISKEFYLVSKEDLHLPQYRNCTQAGHCMIYCESKDRIFNIYAARAVVLMQMRFDGYLGFPGGLVDSGEDIVNGLNRELVEEMNLDLTKVSVTVEDHIATHWCPDKNLCTHFYAHKVSPDDMKLIEKIAFEADDFGEEVLGTVRVPLYTMGDGYRGFPAFLSNAFVGNSRQQLLMSLEQLNIMTSQEISVAQNAKPLSTSDN